MSTVTRYKRVRIHAYVDGELARRLAAYGAATGLNVSTVIRAALAQYLDKSGDTTLLLRRLDRLGRALARAHRDLEFLLEAFAVFVKLWLAHTPRLDDDAKKLARRSAEQRFKQFVDHVVQRFTGGHRFLDDLPREVLADESDLAGVAAEPTASPSPVDPRTPTMTSSRTGGRGESTPASSHRPTPGDSGVNAAVQDPPIAPSTPPPNAATQAASAWPPTSLRLSPRVTAASSRRAPYATRSTKVDSRPSDVVVDAAP